MDPVTPGGEAGFVAGRVLAVMLAALVVLALVGSGLLERFERQALTGLFHVRGPVAPRTPVVIVAVDEGSFDELGLPWPWPRRLHAELLSRMREAGAAVVGFDILFSEPSPWGAADDEAFAEAIAASRNVVLAAQLTTVVEAEYVKRNLTAPLPGIRRGAAAFGPVNLEVDDDAFVRSARLVHTHQRREIPGFAAQVVRLGREAGVLDGPPLPDGEVLINYRGGPATFPTIAFHRVVNGEAPPDLFRGAIVLVGATSPALHDVFPTPFATGGTMPGVEIHANLIETIVLGVPLRRLPLAAALAGALAAVAVAAWITDRMRPLFSIPVVSAIAAGHLGVAWAAFAGANLWLEIVAVPLALVVGSGFTLVEEFVREQRERRRLSRFFSPSVVSEVVRHRSDRALGSSRKVITVLFCDIRSFTAMSERLPPEEVAALLREYLTAMTEAAFAFGGTVDKYIGDAIMVLYNAPIEQEDHAERAVRTALELRKRLEDLSRRWEPRIGMALSNGVGIHTGEAVVGILGSDQRLEYTAVGDTVNVASRLEGLTRSLDAPIVVSESTWEIVKRRFRGRPLGAVAVKGKERPVTVFGIDGPEGAGEAERQSFPSSPRK